ncbi:MAG: copper-binding protein [Chloroflexi bacterium HGW-Chloroflexi-8]|jgi:copper chaperone CopZ|nr:MAG: copper-binding protein [Chloroflexi bacterium HGW-Chloroflexi-8]
MKIETFIVSDMHCPACVMRLEALEDELAGVKRITANYKKQNMIVEFDEMQITSLEIKDAVTEIGYTIA